MQKLKEKLELLVAYAQGADMESILENTTEEQIQDSLELIDDVIELLER